MHSFYLIEFSDLSITRGATHRHIVLAVRHEGKWGAMGLSRRSCLMKKPMEFDSLTDLIRNFDYSYVSDSRDEVVESDVVML
jgi:tubulinyl-Tyr carboxypeptidase